MARVWYAELWSWEHFVVSNERQLNSKRQVFSIDNKVVKSSIFQSLTLQEKEKVPRWIGGNVPLHMITN